jgi:hypothetical protein
MLLNILIGLFKVHELGESIQYTNHRPARTVLSMRTSVSPSSPTSWHNAGDGSGKAEGFGSIK